MKAKAVGIVVLVFELWLISATYAGIVLTKTRVTSVFNAPDAALTGFSSYQIDIATDNGDLIAAVDAIFGGPFHQRYVKTNFDGGPPDPTPNGLPSDGRADSHLTLTQGALIALAPTEDNNVLPSPLPDMPNFGFDYGIGSKLDGAWGIQGKDQTASATLAYVVMPDDRVSELSYNISVATRSGEIFNLTHGAPPVRPPRPTPTPTPPNPTPTPTPVPLPVVTATAQLVTKTFGHPEELLEGFVAYQLSMVAPEGGKFAAVDVSIKGPLHQRWSDTDFDGKADPSLIGPPSDGLGDSHITSPANAIMLLRPDLVREDNNIEPSPLADGEFDYGIGSTMSAIWAIPGATQTDTIQLAYIVIPQDFDPRLLEIDIEAALRFSNGLPTISFSTADFFPAEADRVMVPEPSAGMMLLVSLGLLTTKTKR